MKIYTEVNYELKNGSLLEQSSKFYHYDGEVAECKSSGDDLAEAASEVIQRNTETISEGPTSGPAKLMADLVYGGDLKAGVESVQETYRDAEGGFHYEKDKLTKIPDLFPDSSETEEDTEETTPEERESLLTQGLVAEGGRKPKFGRKAMTTGSTDSSILTPLQ